MIYLEFISLIHFGFISLIHFGFYVNFQLNLKNYLFNRLFNFFKIYLEFIGFKLIFVSIFYGNKLI